MTTSYRVGVLDRIDLLLTALRARPLKAAKVAEVTGMDMSTTYRMLRALEDKGYVSKLPDGRFDIGIKLALFRSTVLESNRFARHTRPFLHELSERTHETAFVMIRDGLKAICLDMTQGPQALQLTVQIGSERPLTTGASSKVLLAHADRYIIDRVLREPIPQLTTTPPPTAEQLRAELARIRELRYGTSKSESTEGAGSIAVPLLTNSEITSLSLAIGGPVDRVLGEHLDKHLEALIDVAAEMREAFVD